MKFWDVDLTAHVRWFQWDCWLALALLYVAARFWERLPLASLARSLAR